MTTTIVTVSITGEVYQPLSRIACDVAGYPHAVYIFGEWLVFHHNGQDYYRRIHRSNTGLPYVVFNKERYYVDNACTLR